MQTSRSHTLLFALAALTLASACSGSSDVSTLQITNLPATSTMGLIQTVYVTALDSSGKAIEDYAGTIHFTTSDPRVQIPLDYSYLSADLGTHPFQITFDNLGPATISVSVVGSPSVSATGSTTTSAPALTSITLDLPADTTAGQPFDVTVTVTDSWAGPATLYTGTVHFTSTDPQAVLPADYTFTAADQGVHTFAGGVTLMSSGAQSITASDSADSLTGSNGATVQ